MIKHEVMHQGHTREPRKDCDDEDMRTTMDEICVQSTNAHNVVKKPSIV